MLLFSSSSGSEEVDDSSNLDLIDLLKNDGSLDLLEDNYIDSLGLTPKEDDEDSKLVSGRLLETIKKESFALEDLLEEDDTVLLLQYMRFKYPQFPKY